MNDNDSEGKERKLFQWKTENKYENETEEDANEDEADDDEEECGFGKNERQSVLSVRAKDPTKESLLACLVHSQIQL